MDMLKKISCKKIDENVFDLIGKQWMLITFGNKNKFNTMTASWGSLGYLWNTRISTIFIRPQRYTYELAEKFDNYTLSFFDKKYKNFLTYCGSHSGRDVDKIKNTGLIPVESELGNIYFEQAKLVIECKKIYYDDINPEHFIDKLLKRNYPNKDYHRMYIGKILNCFAQES